jgi:aspartate racemase
VRTLAIVGGIAPASTVDYYQQLIAAYRARRPDGSYPSLLINSIDLTRLLGLVAEGRLEELTSYLREAIERLARAGADVALLASNTPHIVFEELSRVSPLPLISIVEAAREAAAALGLSAVGLLGTRFTMEGGFYPDVFGRHGIVVLRPVPADIAYVHDRYMGELVAGEYRAETREGMLAVIDRLRAGGAQGVLLAGTELPLLLRGGSPSSLPLLDTTRIHVARAVAELLD